MNKSHNLWNWCWNSFIWHSPCECCNSCKPLMEVYIVFVGVVIHMHFLNHVFDSSFRICIKIIDLTKIDSLSFHVVIRWHPFYGFYLTKTRVLRAGRTQILIAFDTLWMFNHFKWMPRQVLEFPWISVPSNPQLTLDNLSKIKENIYFSVHRYFHD